MDARPAGAAGRSPAERAQTILLVDDEEDIRESLTALFETCLENVRVDAVDSAKAALDILAREPIALIVTDYKMPGMNGLEFLAQASKVAPQVPRILVTAFPDLEIAIRAINEANIQNFFTKPFEPDQILKVMRVILYEQRAQQVRSRALSSSLDLLRRHAGPGAD